MIPMTYALRLACWTVRSHCSLGMTCPGDVLDNSRQENKARLVSKHVDPQLVAKGIPLIDAKQGLTSQLLSKCSWLNLVTVRNWLDANLPRPRAAPLQGATKKRPPRSAGKFRSGQAKRCKQKSGFKLDKKLEISN
jgi:hypothetical protein